VLSDSPRTQPAEAGLALVDADFNRRRLKSAAGSERAMFTSGQLTPTALREFEQMSEDRQAARLKEAAMRRGERHLGRRYQDYHQQFGNLQGVGHELALEEAGNAARQTGGFVARILARLSPRAKPARTPARPAPRPRRSRAADVG
jgi:hypothetical protein